MDKHPDQLRELVQDKAAIQPPADRPPGSTPHVAVGWTSEIEFGDQGSLTMIDSQPKRTVRVYQDEGAGPYLMVLVSQLPEVRALLNRHQVFYWVDRTAISLDHQPATIFVNFLRTEDRGQLQAIFDEAG